MDDQEPDGDQELYFGREQTQVKHELLRQYLLAFALIIGRHWKSITFVDTFSGPWESRSDDLSDTSFSIATSQLKSACRQIESTGKLPPRLRAFFIERVPSAFAKLQNWIAETSGIEIECRNADYADCVDDICAFIAKDRSTLQYVNAAARPPPA